LTQIVDHRSGDRGFADTTLVGADEKDDWLHVIPPDFWLEALDDVLSYGVRMARCFWRPCDNFERNPRL